MGMGGKDLALMSKRAGVISSMLTPSRAFDIFLLIRKSGVAVESIQTISPKSRLQDGSARG
jgi:hypothetical protein